MRLYHGSNISIDNINLAMCRPYAFLLSYCRTQINIRVRRFLDHSCLYDEILETSDPDMFIYIL